MTDLDRLKQLRYGLDWFEDYACQPTQPWKNYRVQVESTRQLVDSMIRRIERHEESAVRFADPDQPSYYRRPDHLEND